MTTLQTKFDLQNSLGREAFAKSLAKDIDDVCVKLYDDGFRSHMGGSVIGDECDMKIWLNFRWAHKEITPGRMYRLWQRGHREELVWIKHLTALGWRVTATDPTQVLHYHSESDTFFYHSGQRTDAEEHEISIYLPKDEQLYRDRVAVAEARGVFPRQIRIVGSEGHFGGSLDAVAEHDDFPGIVFLLEFKTYNDKQYNRLAKEGVQMKSPEHWGQMCVYGRNKGIRYALYMPINKNDDDISLIQCLELDWNLAVSLEAKADFLIRSKQPPERVSDNPSYWKCEYCHNAGVCHRGEPVAFNCRSCRHSEPAQGGEWNCTFHKITIPKDCIPLGCADHFGIVVKQ